MKDRDYLNDTTPSSAGPLLAPHRPHFRVAHVNTVDWSNCPLAKAYDITGETKGGPGRTWGRGVKRVSSWIKAA